MPYQSVVVDVPEFIKDNAPQLRKMHTIHQYVRPKSKISVSTTYNTDILIPT